MLMWHAQGSSYLIQRESCVFRAHADWKNPPYEGSIANSTIIVTGQAPEHYAHT